MNLVALIPARSQSKRIPNKNVRLLNGKPLLYWTIKAALESECFSSVTVSSDSMDILLYAAGEGADGILCPTTVAHKDDDPDILWVRHALGDIECDAFAILRPTSPFRTAETIKAAVLRFSDVQPDSLRAVQQVREHPYKMWWAQERGANPTIWMEPLMNFHDWTLAPPHSSPTQTLPVFYVQNASLEIAWRATVEKSGTISGQKIIPFFTEWPNGIDLNTEEDWAYAEYLIATGRANLSASEHRSAAAVREEAALG